ncbi:MAG: adenosylcobinamide-GDP ribazoletransferase, partial [Candidatus Bathyarchaeia archaeon]
LVLVSAEVTAKFAMVIMAWAGKPADGTTAKPFIAAMHGKTGHIRLASALAVTLILVALLTSTRGLMALGGALVMTFLVQALAHRHFAGLTGDVFGAGNELSRVAFLLVYVASAGI